MVIGDEAACSVNPYFPFDLTQNERRVLKDFSGRLNSEIEDAVVRARDRSSRIGLPGSIRFVDVTEEFIGHELCTGGTYNQSSAINSLVLPLPEFTYYGNAGPLAYSFHPNELGQQLYRDAFDRALSDSQRVNTVVQPQEVRQVLKVTVEPTFAGTLRVSTGWPGSDVVSTLISPSGERFDRNSADPRLKVITTPTAEFLEFEDPDAGTWIVEIFGAEVSPNEPVRVLTWPNEAPPEALVTNVTRTIISLAPLTVQFSAEPVPGATVIWDFGDGTTSNEAVIQHTYASEGPFQPFVTAALPGVGEEVVPVFEVGAGATSVAAFDDVFERPTFIADLPILANDRLPGGATTTVRLVAAPANGTASVQPDGRIRYEPGPDRGNDSFVYEVADGSTSATAIVTLIDSNEDPQATDDQVTVGEDAEITIDVIANDSDPDVDAPDARRQRSSRPRSGHRGRWHDPLRPEQRLLRTGHLRIRSI